MKRWIYGLLAAICLILAVMPAAGAADIVNYAVTGGSIKFDKSTGTVTDCDESVTAVDIPNQIGGVNVTSIGNNAFYCCRSLTSVTIPNSVTSIGMWAFYECTSLTSISIPDSVTAISRNAFASCFNLTNVNIPNNLTSISEYTFANCTSLTSVSIPDSVTSIDSRAFEGCTGLTSMNIPSNVTSIGSGAFNNCTKLLGIMVATGNPSYISIDGVLFDKSVRELHTYPGGKSGTYSIPSTVTTIGDFAFCGCCGLASVSIPNSVTSIGESAFYNCVSLRSVVIPNGVTSIGATTFYQCVSLTSVSIPNSVTSVGYSAFAWCNTLADVYYDGTEVEFKANLLPNVDNNSNFNHDFLNATFHYNDSPAPTPDPTPDPSPNPSPGTLPNTAARDNTALYGIFFLSLSALTLMVWALGRRKKGR